MKRMKDSGIEWVGNIPMSWNVHPLYYYFNEHKQKNFLGAEVNLLSLSYGRIIRKDINTTEGLLPESFNGYNVVSKGDIVLRLTDLQNDRRSLRTGLVKERGIITSAYVTIRPKRQINPDYFRYLLYAYDLEKVLYNMGNGVRQGLNYSELSKMLLIEPELSEQRRIASFLDAKCAEIDALTTNIQAQINMLEQYKRSVITEAVTKGLNPNVEMTDSKITWISKTPSMWKLSKIKYEITPQQRPVYADDSVMTCFRDGEVTLRQNRREEGFTISLTENGYQGVEKGDLVIHGMDAFAGAIGCADSRGKITPVVHVCRTTGNNRFFMYVLRSMAFNDVLMSFSEGIRVRSSDFRNFYKLGKFPIVVPPIDEQDEITYYLDGKCGKIDAIIEQENEQIEILDEYKKSLIFEYVTGKKNVM